VLYLSLDPYMRGCVDEGKSYAKPVEIGAETLDLSPAQREALELGALLPNIGETRTPEAILQKPGPLTVEERRVVEQHPGAGADILEAVPLLTPTLDVVEGLHERYDGEGYPKRLRGEEIPLTARFFAVVNALDAMTHSRSYCPVQSVVQALDEIRGETGKQFNPRVVEAALVISEERWGELLGQTHVREPVQVA
jgi:HD-GYP domain-containing protein (c-di-GMP phosphodiesterase class II)